MLYHVEFEQWVPAAIERVFLFFANPGNLPRIMPPGTKTELIALITEFEWNHHFADVQKEGPLKSFYHRHEMRAEIRGGVNGTVVRDLINYDVGFGWMGNLAQRFFVSRQLQGTFTYRQKALEKLLG